LLCVCPVVRRPAAGGLASAALFAVIVLLAAAAFGRHYRSAGRAAAAGGIGLAAFDATMLIAITFADPAVIWPIIVGMTASLARVTFTTRTPRCVLTG